MPKAYLDTNIFRRVAKNEFGELELLKGLKSRIVYCFANPHLADLAKDVTERKFEDLRLMETLVDNNYLELNGKNVFPYLASPLEAFKSFEESCIDPPVWLDSFNPLGSSEFAAAPAIQELLNQKFPFPAFNFGSLPEPLKGFLNAFFPKIENGISYNEILIHYSNFYRDFTANNGLYKKIRGYSIARLPLDRSRTDIQNSRFALDLKQAGTTLTFFDWIEMSLKHIKSPEFYDKFCVAFFALNVLGLDQEPNKNVKFINTMHDANHAFFAGHCDFLVTDDKGLARKSKCLYNFFQCNTQVFTFEEFIALANNYQLFREKNRLTFLNEVRNEIKYGFVNGDVTDYVSARVFQHIIPKHNLLDHFNCIQVPKAESENTVVLFKRSKNFGELTLYKEIEIVVNNTIAIFGLDKENIGAYNVDDFNNLKNRTWPGRYWDDPILGSVVLCYNRKNSTLTLSIENV